MRATVCEVGAEGRAAIGADNRIGPEGAASLAPAVEEMTQLTSLELERAHSRFGRGPGGLRRLGAWCLWCVQLGRLLGLDVLWLGYALKGGRCVRRFARCVLRGGAGGDGCRE
jgi:hypothetical protein